MLIGIIVIAKIAVTLIIVVLRVVTILISTTTEAKSIISILLCANTHTFPGFADICSIARPSLMHSLLFHIWEDEALHRRNFFSAVMRRLAA